MMNKKIALKRKLHIATLILGFVFLGALHGCSPENAKTEVSASDEALIEDGYVPLKAAMQACKYKNTISDESKYVFTKKDSGVEVSVEFLFDKNKCIKNEYQFDLASNVVWSKGVYFIKRDKFKEIANVEVTYENKRLIISPLEYGEHEWTTAFAPLVAHAGGGYREGNKKSSYTNSLDAIIQNYNLGHRVFEIDFRLTTDKELAAVHAWKDENDEKIKMTAKQWKEEGKVKGTVCRTMLIGDVLDQMVINKDMFLITDTKTYKVGKNMKREFELITKEAKKRDPKLLERIIPQIYNREMYATVTKAHPFQSIIFTMYRTKETDDEVIEFMAAHDDVKVVTTKGNEKGRLNLVEPLSEHGKLIYVHTLNKYKDIGTMQGKGVYGIYTDFLTPSDWQKYMNNAK